MPVPQDVLLRGAWYAIEQAGCMVRDSVTLYDAGAHASAAGIALLGREELGRHVILVQLWNRTRVGELFSGKDVRQAYVEHMEKQRRSLLSLTYRIVPESGFAKLMATLWSVVPFSAEAQALRAHRSDLDRRTMKRTPDDRHFARMRALYVDLNDAATDWNRPIDFPKAEASACVDDAVGDYAFQKDHLTTPGILELTDEPLARALAAWRDKPDLPAVVWRRLPQ